MCPVVAGGGACSGFGRWSRSRSASSFRRSAFSTSALSTGRTQTTPFASRPTVVHSIGTSARNSAVGRPSTRTITSTPLMGRCQLKPLWRSAPLNAPAVSTECWRGFRRTTLFDRARPSAPACALSSDRKPTWSAVLPSHSPGNLASLASTRAPHRGQRHRSHFNHGCPPTLSPLRPSQEARFCYRRGTRTKEIEQRDHEVEQRKLERGDRVVDPLDPGKTAVIVDGPVRVGSGLFFEVLCANQEAHLFREEQLSRRELDKLRVPCRGLSTDLSSTRNDLLVISRSCASRAGSRTSSTPLAPPEPSSAFISSSPS